MLLAVAVALCVALASVGAAASTPDLTGTWFDPSAAAPRPAWHLQTSPDLSKLTASWTGGRGHEGLRGHFHGTLRGDTYSGALHITEGSVVVNGPMSFRIVTPNRLSVTYRQSNGVRSTFTLRRSAPRRATIRFSFRGYANDVRVRPPLVGPFQLGKARIHGSGTLGGAIQGDVFDSFHPRFSRYRPASMHARVVGYSYRRAAHGVSSTLRLTIEIVQTDEPRCAAGDRGTLTLHQTRARLANGQTGDYIVMGDWGGRCAGLVQGWTNDDGGARTSPRFGGPPHGGQWAIVDIR